MEPFEQRGLWWLAAAPEDRVAGVLRFTNEDGVVLSLFGMLGGRETGVSAKSHHIILGTLYGSRPGPFVTLRDCVQLRHTMTSTGLNAEDYHAGRAFFGRHLTEPGDFLFSECRVGIGGLSGWVAHLSGIQLELGSQGREDNYQVRLTYTPPPPLRAEIPGGWIILHVGAEVEHSLRKASLKEVIRFVITVAEQISADEWNGRYVYPLMNLLTLATDVPNALTDWELADAKSPFTRVTVVGQRVFNEDAEDPAVTPHRMLIPLEGSEGRFPDLVTRWLDVADKYQDSCNIFFGLRYAPGAYTDMRLLGIGQALELYQAKRVHGQPPSPPTPPPEVLTALPPQAQEEWRRWAEGVTCDTFRETLTKLACEHETTLKPLSPDGLESLISEIMSYRNYVIHRTKQPAAPEGFGRGLFRATETLSCLVKSCFLAELGFTPEERGNLFGRNAMYNFLQDEWTAALRAGEFSSSPVV